MCLQLLLLVKQLPINDHHPFDIILGYLIALGNTYAATPATIFMGDELAQFGKFFVNEIFHLHEFVLELQNVIAFFVRFWGLGFGFWGMKISPEGVLSGVLVLMRKIHG